MAGNDAVNDHGVAFTGGQRRETALDVAVIPESKTVENLGVVLQSIFCCGVGDAHGVVFKIADLIESAALSHDQQMGILHPAGRQGVVNL